jgi:hypothetical protein
MQYYCIYLPVDVGFPLRPGSFSFFYLFSLLFLFFSFSFLFSFFHILPLLATLVGIGTLECLTVPTFGPISYPNKISDSQIVQLNQKMVTACSTTT